MKRKRLSDEENRALRFIKAMGGLPEVMRGFQKGMTYESDLAEILYGDPYKKVDERQAISEVFNRLETEEKRSKFFNGWGGFDKFVRFFEGILGRYAEDAKTLDELFDAIEQATLPQGCEWPKDRNGKSIKPNYPVNIYGEKMRIVAISHKDRLCIRPWEKANGGGGFWVKSSEVSLSPCGQETGAEKKVLDADGNRVHIGDTVYATSDDATEFTVSGFRGGKVIVKRAGHASKEIYPWFITRHPFVLAADGKPLKVGQTVWNINNGMEFNVSRLPKPGEYQAVEVRHRNGSSTSFDPCRLTHQRPVLDADGVPINKGDTVYSIETGEPVTVNCVEGGNPWFRATAGTMWHCSKFTHRAPVFAADGKPLREGETVWGVTGASYRITGAHDGGVFARHVNGSFGAEVKTAGGEGLYQLRADKLTHERPDSWERIEEDAQLNPDDYWMHHSVGDEDRKNVALAMARDILHRCKALAEQERGE